jgi:hypothetical protein
MNIFKKEQKYHWYTVKFYYRDNNGYLKFDFSQEIGVLNKREILNHRSTKKAMAPMHLLNNGSQKRFICNGKLSAEAVCYLGYFAKPIIPKTNEPKRKENQRSIWRQIRAIIPR